MVQTITNNFLEILDNYIFNKSIKTIGNDNCADLTCSQFFYDIFITKLESYNKERNILDYSNLVFYKQENDDIVEVKSELILNIDISAIQPFYKIVVGNDIGQNEHELTELIQFFENNVNLYSFCDRELKSIDGILLNSFSLFKNTKINIISSQPITNYEIIEKENEDKEFVNYDNDVYHKTKFQIITDYNMFENKEINLSGIHINNMFELMIRFSFVE